MPSKLSDVNIQAGKFEEMAKNAMADWGQIGSFKQLSEDDIVQILSTSI